MQNPEQPPITEQPPNHEQFVRRWQFSLASLMIAMSLVCLLLVDRRTVALFAVIVIVRLGGGKVIRGAAVGGIVGVCLGLYGWDQHLWDWNTRRPTDDVFTILTLGACMAWLFAAIQLTKRGEKVGPIALLTFLVWLPYWLVGQMR